MMNWEARIARAKKRGAFARTDKALCGPWISCAVGEHRGEYAEEARSAPGAPQARTLRNLGGCFAGAVEGDDIDAAGRVWTSIQAWFRRYGKRRAPRWRERVGRREVHADR